MSDDEDALYADTPELDQGRWSAPVPAVRPKQRRAIDGPLRHTYRTIRDAYRARCASAGLPCAICRRPINYRLQHGDPGAFELDHIQGVEEFPNLALVETNFQPSHSVCNKRRAAVQALDRGVGVGGRDVDETAIAVFVIDGRRIEYEYSVDVGAPSEPW